MLERADHQRRVTWLSLLGLILVPVILAAGFLWATWGAADRLHQVNAAVVNTDKAVKLNGQLVPLGRQLAGGLVDSPDTNFRWRLVNAKEARDGLKAGRYVAVVTIPEDFSKTATSFSGKASDASQATLDVQTSDIAGVTDSTVANRIAEVARAKLNTTLTENYLKQVYVGFNDTKKQFGKVADGADRLAEGTTELSNGVSKASDGTAAFSDGVRQYTNGVSQYTGGVHQISSGVGQLAGGVNELEANLTRTSAADIKKQQAELDQLSGAMTQLSNGAAGISTGLTSYDKALPDIGTEVGNEVAQQGCLQFKGAPNEAQLCQIFTAGATAGATATAQAASDGLNYVDPTTKSSLLSGAAAEAAGLKKVAPGVTALVEKVKPLPGQMNQLADGVTQLSNGADQLAAGAAKLDANSSKLSSGGTQLASGADQLASGMVKLDDGTRELASGTKKFADELRKGAAKIPVYSEQDRERLATSVANPVKAPPQPDSLLAQVPAVSLLMVVALWLGGFATYLVVQAIAASTLLSSRPSWQLVARALAPGIGIVAVQALAVTLTGQAVLDLSAATMLKVLGLLLFGGVVFVAVNHALVAWLGGWGRLISIVAVVLTAAAAITSAVPTALDSLVPYLPLSPALVAVRSIMTNGDSIAPQIGALLLWFIGALIASVAAVLRQRTITPAQLRARFA